MIRIFTSSILLLLSIFNAVAQTDIKSEGDKKTIVLPPVDCKPAKDSLKNRLARGEISFYNLSSYQTGQYDFVTISKNRYTKVAYPKGYPLPSFISCYNKEIKKTLDSIYKVDFFKRTDSILNNYDKTGRGYYSADFPGGPGALQKFMDKNVSLPKDAKADNADKLIRVYYSFTIDEKGNLSDIKLLKSNCKSCEDSVFTAIKKMPPFKPATEAGAPKKIKYILPYTKS